MASISQSQTHGISKCSCGSYESEFFKFNWLFNKWMALIGSMWVLTSTGVLYDFSIFSPKLKEVLGYSQSQINLIGTASDSGGSIGLVAGFLSLIIPPWAMLLFGGISNLIGFGFLWLTAIEAIHYVPFIVVFAAMAIGTSSNTYFQTITLMVCVENFPETRGMAVGVLKGVVGLGGAIYSQIYTAFFFPEAADFLLLAAVSPFIVSLLAIIVVRYYKPRSTSRDANYLYIFLTILLALAVYILVEILISAFFSVGDLTNRTIAISLLVILGIPILVPVHYTTTEACQLHKAEEPAILDDPETGVKEANTAIKAPLAHGQEDDGKTSLTRGPQIGILDAIHTEEFWLLFLSMVTGVSSGFVVTGNLAQIGAAQGVMSTNSAASLFNVSNFFGRICGGFGSDYILKKYGFPRSVMTVGAHLLLAFGHLVFAFALRGSIYIGSIFVGFGAGCVFAVITTTTTEFFGMYQFGMIYSVLTCAIPLGSFLFSTLLAGTMYDLELSLEISLQAFTVKSLTSTSSCSGARCYMATFLVLSFLAWVGAIANVFLTRRTTQLYRTLYPR